MLKRARVQGFKCLRDVTVDLGPFNVLIGPNDSGKSSFLQALAEPSLALLRWHPTDVSAVSNGEWTMDLEGESGTFGYEPVQFSKPCFDSPAGSERLNFLSRRLAEIWFKKHHEFSSTDPVSLDPGQIASSSPARDALLDHFVASRGAGTAAHLAALALGDRERFDAIERSVQEVTKGRVRNLLVKDIGGSTYTLTFKLVDGAAIPAAHMSQGLLLYVAFQALLQRDSMPGLLLVEEPERGLHPQRLVELVATLRRLSEQRVQVVLTTHSPDVLSACKPSEVRIFRRQEAGSATEVHSLPPDVDDDAAREPLGHVWAARGEDGLLSLASSPRLLESGR